MFEKILKELKTKYADKGLSETILKAKAKQIEKAVKTEDEIENAVAGVEADMEIFQILADQNRTLANDFKKFKDASEGKTEEQKAAEEKEEAEKKQSGDVPAWAQAIIDSNKTLSESLTAIKTKETQQTNAEKFQSKLKELEVSDDYLKTLPTFERSFQTDEEIETIAKEYKEKSDVFVQMSANSALGNMVKPSLFSTEVKEGAVSPEVQAIIDSKKAKTNE